MPEYIVKESGFPGTIIKEVQGELMRCRDCKHRPAKVENNIGFAVVFPDDVCPCGCEDSWYNWMLDDDFYCKYGEREDGEVE